MRALAERTRLVRAALVVEEIGTLIVGRNGSSVSCDWQSGGPGATAWRAFPAGSGGGDSLVLPISYADARLGELRLDMDSSSPVSEREAALLGHFARQCGLLVKRWEVRRWSERKLGRPLLLVGMSKALRDLEAFVEISARGRLPVLLRGEFGTEKAQLAATIHCCSPVAEGPFVQVECAEPSAGPDEWVRRAEGGTLYLSGVDELDPRLQKLLPQHLPSRLHQWLPPSAAQPVRVIASTTADLHERAREGRFSRPLLAELDFLTITIPPLRERGGDIEPLIADALERNGYRPEEKATDELVSLFRAHDWPENLFELERMIARLAVMSEGRPIERADIDRHAPDIAANSETSDSHGSGEGEGAGADAWARAAIAGAGPPLDRTHDSLRRALLHLGSHFDEPITLSRLAQRSGVSPSHLGYLFRTEIGQPFKAVLGRIRILRARELLAAGRGRNITQIALSVGFSDLSHFERSFRRLVGQTPREYRRNAMAG